MTNEHDAGMAREVLSPHLRQRVAFIAALIPDIHRANWPAISDTWDDISQETKGTAFEKSVESLQEPIQQKDAELLVENIGALLNLGESPEQASALDERVSQSHS
jgi:hypothetical protein